MNWQKIQCLTTYHSTDSWLGVAQCTSSALLPSNNSPQYDPKRSETSRQSPGSRCYYKQPQTVDENVFVFSVPEQLAHNMCYDDVFYKFTFYLLTYLIVMQARNDDEADDDDDDD